MMNVKIKNLVVVATVLLLAAGGAQAGFLYNETFEDGTVGDWDTCSIVTADAARTGNFGMRVRPTNCMTNLLDLPLIDPPAAIPYPIEVTIPFNLDQLPANSTWALEVRYDTTGDGVEDNKINMGINNWTAPTWEYKIPFNQGPLHFISTGVWHEFKVVFTATGIEAFVDDDPKWDTATPNARPTMIDVGWIQGTGEGSYAVDDVTVTPEPVTMAMLGIGGLALLRRRRM